MNTAAAPVDALSARLAALVRHRGHVGWPQALLDFAQELTLARSGMVLAQDGGAWVALAPAGQGTTLPWQDLAAQALAGQAVAFVQAQGQYGFAVPVGPAAGKPAVLCLQVVAAHAMDLALTRERLALLGSMAMAGAITGPLQAALPMAVAAAVVEAFLRAPDMASATHAAAQRLQQAVPDAVRLSLAVFDRGRLLALGMSDQAAPDPAAELPRLIVPLLEEALDLQAPRLTPGQQALSPAEQRFHARFGARPMLALAAPQGGATLLVEMPLASPAPPEVAAGLAPALALLAQAARGRPPRLRAQVVRQRWRLAGLGVAALLALAFLPCDAVVEASFSLRPEQQQVITAPFDGILERSSVQPGDAVRAEQTVLARLATREIELELAAARARAANDRREATIARAAGQAAQEQIALLAAQRAEAQLALLQHRLRLAEIRSPVDGTVLQGDWRRSQGQPVTRGQTLFEVAAPEGLRAEVLVQDQFAPRVAEGQVVRLAPAAEPGRIYMATVLRVRPLAEPANGMNVFRVIAKLDDQAALDGLRPGTEGIARVVTGRTTWLGSMLEAPIRTLRRWMWL